MSSSNFSHGILSESFPAAPPPDAATFYDAWGNMLNMDTEQLQATWRAARSHYEPRLYFNFCRAREIAATAMDLADRSEEAGMVTDRQALLLGALWYGADSHLPPTTAHAYEEERSAMRMKSDAEQLGFAGDHIRAAASAILALRPGMPVETHSDRILIRAKYDYLGRNYDRVFYPRNAQYETAVKERCHEQGLGFSRPEFETNRIYELASLLDNDLSLGRNDSDGWIVTASDNLYRYSSDVAFRQQRNQGELLQEIGCSAVNWILGHDHLAAQSASQTL